MLGLSLILVACANGKNIIERDIEDLLLLESISYNQKTALVLPYKGKHGSTITWISSNPEVVTHEGIILPPKKGETSIQATLSATLKNGFSSQIKNLNITVLPFDDYENITSSKNISFTNLSNEYNLNLNQIPTYFLDNGNIPYLNIEESLLLLDGLIYSKDLEFLYTDSGVDISYLVESNSNTFEYKAYFNELDNTITSSSLNFFSSYFYSTQTDFSKGLDVISTEYNSGLPIKFDLDEYRMDLFKKDNNLYMPAHLFNILFLNDSYFNLYYNYDNFYGIYAIPEDNVVKTLRESSLNNTYIPFDIVRYNYDFYAFTFDYFYGISKPMSFYSYSKAYLKNFLSRDPQKSSLGQFQFINEELDELHSSYDADSFYLNKNKTTKLTSLTQLGEKTQNWYQTLYQVQALTKARPSSNYKFLDNETAIIYLDSFDTKASTDLNGKDSSDFMKKL
ncbi:peptidase, S41 family [Alteracholeplasma palmae J233]|uniref:Peptidase, S41 family n=1 Tax=Alteracholeplasma palmae (strain ATCC 49389 / J233) TaxID=1318466 RepID=U4KJY9_ALTPJ|nr:peptidase, S41 family [Alteracholeplasma palmae J233]